MTRTVPAGQVEQGPGDADARVAARGPRSEREGGGAPGDGDVGDPVGAVLEPLETGVAVPARDGAGQVPQGDDREADDADPQDPAPSDGVGHRRQGPRLVGRAAPSPRDAEAGPPHRDVEQAVEEEADAGPGRDRRVRLGDLGGVGRHLGEGGGGLPGGLGDVARHLGGARSADVLGDLADGLDDGQPAGVLVVVGRRHARKPSPVPRAWSDAVVPRRGPRSQDLVRCAEGVGLRLYRVDPRRHLPRPPAPLGRELPREAGGGRGIRTHDDVAAIAVFKTAALGHYASPPRPDRPGTSQGMTCRGAPSDPFEVFDRHPAPPEHLDRARGGRPGGTPGFAAPTVG